ncbi:MAG: hypothetical protein BWX57_00345 [Tenericutes bacterium ADurb.Bin024]|nr:MAG: hypothetical protein BWX57_00345 [Tenericutes bacterium ADurb.Bin024]HPY78494.1 hypothetical protein [Bacilli bacterium]HQB96324.1 hypothetical protein [Bacilli bacterium]
MLTTLGLVLTTCLSFGNIKTEDKLTDYKENVITKSNSANNTFSPEIVYEPEIKSTMLNGEDAYEPNNTKETATRLSPLNHYAYESYSSSVSANLKRTSGFDDWDYYAVVLLTDSHVSVTAVRRDASPGFNLGISAYNSTDNTNPRDITSRYSYFIHQDISYTQDKYFTGLLKAGTYFIEIYRKDECLPTDIVDYSLTISVQKDNTNREAVYIPDLKFNKNLPAAIWLSDFQPAGFNFNPAFWETYYHKTTNNKNEFEYALNDLMQYTEYGGLIHASSIYVWDYAVKQTMRGLFSELAEIVDNIHNTQGEIIANINLYLEIMNATCKVVGTILNTTGLGSFAVDIALTAVEEGLIPLIEFLVNETLVKEHMQTGYYYAYLQRYVGVFDGSDNSDAVIEFPLYYKPEKTNPVMGHSEHYITFEPTINEVLSSPSTTYTNLYIDSCPDSSTFSKGRIYGFSTIENVGFDDLILISDYDNVIPEATEIFLTSSTSAVNPLRQGEYKWFYFNAPQTKRYYFLARGAHNINVDLFNSVVTGYSNNGLIRTHTTKYTSPDLATNVGVLFSEIVEGGTTLFFRVRGKDYLPVDVSTTFNVSDEPVANAYTGTLYSVNPEDYDFQPQYFFSNSVKKVFLTDYNFNTNRLRTGYIEQEYINLSPRREGAGTAFLEYTFNDPVIKIEVDLSFWGPYEYIDNTNATAIIEYKDERGNWITALDLLDDVELSTDRYNQDTYIINFPTNGTKCFRYYMTSEAVGSRNKGRISVGTTRIYVDKI